MLDHNYISRPMIIEELLQYSKADFMSFHDLYNYESLFNMGVYGHLYVIFPLLSMASLNRYCDERTSGFWTQKIIKSGRVIGTLSNMISSSLIGIMSLLVGLGLYILCILLRLPYQRVEVSKFLFAIFSLCLVVILSAFLSTLIAALTRNKFYSFVIPLLLFYAENELMLGLEGGVFSNFSVQTLMRPGNNIVNFSFIMIISVLLYKAVDRIEKGRCGIGV